MKNLGDGNATCFESVFQTGKTEMIKKFSNNGHGNNIKRSSFKPENSILPRYRNTREIIISHGETRLRMEKNNETENFRLLKMQNREVAGFTKDINYINYITGSLS